MRPVSISYVYSIIHCPSKLLKSYVTAESRSFIAGTRQIWRPASLCHPASHSATISRSSKWRLPDAVIS